MDGASVGTRGAGRRMEAPGGGGRGGVEGEGGGERQGGGLANDVESLGKEGMDLLRRFWVWSSGFLHFGFGA